MKHEQFKNAYPNPPEDFHNAVLSSLYKLNSKAPVRYKKRRAVKIAVVCAVIAALGSFTAVAAATDFFGLFAAPVGKFGLHVGVTENTDAPLKHVKMNFGYMPEGFEELPHMPLDVRKFQNPNTENGACFSFDAVPAKDFDYTQTYIIDSEETVVNGHRLILTTRQMTEGGEIDYGATMYFEDWGYVVSGGAYYGASHEELRKIMQNLSLEENADYISEPTVTVAPEDESWWKRSGYEIKVDSNFTVHKRGEAFLWGSKAHADNFTVKVTSVQEQTGIEGVPAEYFNWTSDYSLFYSEYFDENGKLKTPYIRHDITESDGVNTQRREWDTEDDRHFFVVTVELTQNAEEDFDIFGDFSPVVLIQDSDGSYRYNGQPDEYGVTQSVLYGDYQVVCSTPGDEAALLHMNKGETRTLTYGIVIDDDILDNAYLRFNSSGEPSFDDEAETVTLHQFNDCVRIKE